MKNDFEQRKKNRIESARKQAEKNEKLSDSYYNQATEMASHIPMGQPILVGHHSEKGDRRYRKRIDDKMRKSIEADDKAKYYRQKAETIEENAAISSDDPEAIAKLKEKLTELEQKRSFMKATNKMIRRKDKNGFLMLPHATEALWQELNTPDRTGGVGFPHYSLTNNNATIRSVKRRIEQLELLAQRPEHRVTFKGGELRENKEAGRIQFEFEKKPEEPIRKLLRRGSFRWTPSEGVWQRQLNANGIWSAKHVLQQINEYHLGQQG